MNILDQHINETSHELTQLWANLDECVATGYNQSVQADFDELLKTTHKLLNLRKEHNRFYKLLIYKLAAYNLFGLHLRKIIAYLNVSNEMFQILQYYKNFFNFLLERKITSSQQKIINNLWHEAIQLEIKVKNLFLSKDKTQVLDFLKTFHKNKKKLIVHFLDLVKSDELAVKKSLNLFSPVGLLIFEQIRGLQRISDHFVQILESHLLTLDFAEYKRYRDDKIIS